jgi:predicted  nucleic acid-binding Zn-ribbon protein
MDDEIQTRIARLESDVRHIQTNVADIKVDLRRIDDRIDSTNNRLDVLRDKLEQGIRNVSSRMDGLHERQTKTTEDVRQDLSYKIENVREDLTRKIRRG